MTTFPALVPSSRVFTPGEHPHTGIRTLAGQRSSVRHGDAILGQIVALTFVGLSEADMLSIRTHYRNRAGRFRSFNTPAAIWTGAASSAVFTPTLYQWLYRASPRVEDIGCGQYNVTVQLEAVAPQVASAPGAYFDIVVTLTTGGATGGAVAPAAALIVAALLTAGAASSTDGVASGSALTINCQLTAGAATSTDGVASGIDLTISCQLVAGAGSVAGSATGAALTVTMSLAAGSASGGSGDDDAGFAGYLYWEEDMYASWR